MFNIQEILKNTLLHKGYSVNINGNVPTEGYMVSLRGTEMRVKTEVSIAQMYTDLRDYVKSNMDKLFKDYIGAYPTFLGTWIEDGIIYFDISENILGQNEAYRIAQLRSQISFYDVVNDKVLSTVPYILDNQEFHTTVFYQWLDFNEKEYNNFLEAIKEYTKMDKPFVGRTDGQAHKYVFEYWTREQFKKEPLYYKTVR